MAEYGFLFTDIAGSSRLWETYPDAMESALAEHDALLRGAIEAAGGSVFSTMGDGMAAAFEDVDAAVRAAVDAQRALVRHQWRETGPLRVRMGVHAGPAQRRGDDYFGRTLNRCARLMAVGHGGQVLLSGAAVMASSAPVEMRDLGVHRLRDLGEPEHIFQVVTDGLPADFPALVTLDARPGNLPAQATTFVGRDADVAAVTDDLEQARVVTLTGVGGVGKTRLAVQVGAEVLPRFRDGVWLCELAPIGNPEAVPHAIAAALDIVVDAGASVVEALLTRLTTSQLLLIVDNCEHVIDAVGLLVEQIVHRCPNVTIIATSREPLAVEGEKVRVVRSLSSDAAAALFADRAVAVRSDVAPALTGDTAVGDICQRLDGVPLAIELAAARVSSMSPSEIATRLDERFRLLTGGRRTAVERHRTLRSTVDWSYELLAKGEQRVLARLAVFAGGFTLAAAERVAADTEVEVLDALQSLVDKSMVIADPSDDHGYRYSMLETIRQYAEERLLDAGEADEVRRRHAEYFAEFAHAGAVGEGTRESAAWSARLDGEIDNFRAALEWATNNGDAVIAARLFVDLGFHAYFHLWSEADAWGIAVMEVVRAHGAVPDDMAARAAATSGNFAWGAGDIDRAQRTWMEGTDFGARDPRALADLALLEAAVMLATGRIAEAVDADERAVVFARESGEEWLTGLHLAHLAMSLAAATRKQDALAAAREGFEIGKRAGSDTALAFAGFACADAIIDDDPDTAVAYLRDADAAAAASNLAFVRVLTRTSLISAQGRSSDPHAAVPGYLEVLDHWIAAGAVVHQRSVIRNAAEMLSRLGRLDVVAVVHGAMQAAGVEPPAGSPEALRRDAALDAARAELGAGFGAAVDRGKQMSDAELADFVREALLEFT